MPKQQYPQPTVGAFIFNSKGEIFLIKTHKWPSGVWAVPGGKVELGETLENALKREAKEETGLTIYGVKLLTVFEFIFEPTFFKKRHFIFFDYICRTKTEKVKLDKKEASEYVWIAPKKALEQKLEKYTRKVIKKYLMKESKVYEPMDRRNK